MIVINAAGLEERHPLRLQTEYYRQWIEQLAQSNQVIVLADHDEFDDLKGNTETRKLSFPGRSPLKRYWWYGSYLKRLSTELGEFLLYSFGVLPANFKPGYILLEPEEVHSRGFYGKLLRKSLSRATAKRHLGQEKLLPFAVNESVIHDDDEIREAISGDNFYFLYYGYLSNSAAMVRLLKAYSGFKKRQRSSMVLVLLGRRGSDFDGFEKLLQTYRFRADVVVIDENLRNHYEDLFSAAYSLVFPDAEGTHFSALLTGWRLGVPAIVPNKGILQEMGGDATLAFEAGSYEDLGIKLIQMFQDETGRGMRIAKGKELLNELERDSFKK